jgi:hypothetical protein
MRVLFVQLSDIHFRSASNPISARVGSLVVAIRSIAPKPDFCVVLVTGDVAYSGQIDEYKNSEKFFSDLKADLSGYFGGSNLHFEFIPGNHDCFLPESEVELRAVVVRGIHPNCLTRPRPKIHCSGSLSNRAFDRRSARRRRTRSRYRVLAGAQPGML